MASKTDREVAMRLLAALLIATGLAVTATQASEPLLVGKTNIFCVSAPCPWRGIMAADSKEAGASALLWSEQTLPELDASPEDAERIVAAWNGDRCLAIHGRLAEGRLTVVSVLGECPR
jgi:hypothetical protein